ncbi:MAG: armadillo-type protein, partial [Olpidium bornovanus]
PGIRADVNVALPKEGSIPRKERQQADELFGSYRYRPERRLLFAGGALVFGQHLDKSTVLQEARVFNESPLTFAGSKLNALQNGLRQMVYLAIKELTQIAEDASMMQGIERFLKASIVDSNAAIASASLVSSYHLFNVSRDVVRRWVNEVHQVATKLSWGFHSIVQYHAIGLLYLIRQHDRMAVSKLVQSFTGTTGSMGAGSHIKANFAQCLLIRYACKVAEDDPGLRQTIYDVLEGWLRNRGDIQISSFMSELSDEFKVIVIDAIRALCLKFPSKQAVMLGFLSGVLRDEGGYEYKKAVVEAIVDLVKSIPECKESALPHLCEYIEDCEFTKLSVRILHLLGEEGPRSKTPKKLIRFIYTRLILENSIVRAAAVSALTQFGLHAARDDPLYETIKVILWRCMDDNDDEVRDRAILYLAILEKDDPKTSSAIQLGKAAVSPTKAVLTAGGKVGGRDVDGAGTPLSAGMDQQGVYASQLGSIPEFEPYGPLFKSSKPVELTESGTEYTVSCFNTVNTIADSLLEDVTVIMTPEEEDNGLHAEIMVPAEKLACNAPAYIADFKSTWDSLSPENEIIETFELTALKSIAGAFPKTVSAV